MRMRHDWFWYYFFSDEFGNCEEMRQKTCRPTDGRQVLAITQTNSRPRVARLLVICRQVVSST